jgi:hypothetical protein
MKSEISLRVALLGFKADEYLKDVPGLSARAGRYYYFFTAGVFGVIDPFCFGGSFDRPVMLKSKAQAFDTGAARLGGSRGLGILLLFLRGPREA